MNNLKPTEKQMNFIKNIESLLDYYGIKFVGTTREEASCFISTNLDLFNHEKSKMRAMKARSKRDKKRAMY